MENVVCFGLPLICSTVFVLKILLLIGVLWVINNIIQNMINQRKEDERQYRLDDYCQKRSAFYRQEREKVLNYYREKAQKNGGLTDEELEEARFYMEINGGNEDGWKKEYEDFLHQYRR